MNTQITRNYQLPLKGLKEITRGLQEFQGHPSIIVVPPNNPEQFK